LKQAKWPQYLVFEPFLCYNGVMNSNTKPTIFFRQSLFWDTDPGKIDAEKTLGISSKSI
jgi:hypothetical protein